MRSTLRLSILLFAALTCAGLASVAQNAYHVDLVSLMARITVPQNTTACYAGCTTKTDPSNGAVTVVNTDPTYQGINEQLDKINKAAFNDANAQMPNRSQAPSADQIQQMQQQAMQKAASMQGMSPQQMAAAQQAKSQSGAPSKEEMAVLQKLGQAQSAAGRITQLVNEMSQKFSKLDKSKINSVPMGASCPEVQQGSYAGPTCECLIKKESAYQSQREANYNQYLQVAAALIEDYMGKIKDQLVIVDQFEVTAKYGDAVSNPAFKPQVAAVQRQAMNGVVAVLAAANGNWEDAAKMHAQVVNANNGATVGCGGHKQ